MSGKKRDYLEFNTLNKEDIITDDLHYKPDSKKIKTMLDYYQKDNKTIGFKNIKEKINSPGIILQSKISFINVDNLTRVSHTNTTAFPRQIATSNEYNLNVSQNFISFGNLNSNLCRSQNNNNDSQQLSCSSNLLAQNQNDTKHGLNRSNSNTQNSQNKSTNYSQYNNLGLGSFQSTGSVELPPNLQRSSSGINSRLTANILNFPKTRKQKTTTITSKAKNNDKFFDRLFASVQSKAESGKNGKKESKKRKSYR